MTRSGKWRRKRSAEWPLLSYGSPITSVLRAAAMTSFVTTLSPLIFMMRSIWVNGRCRSRKLPRGGGRPAS